MRVSECSQLTNAACAIVFFFRFIFTHFYSRNTIGISIFESKLIGCVWLTDLRLITRFFHSSFSSFRILHATIAALSEIAFIFVFIFVYDFRHTIELRETQHYWRAFIVSVCRIDGCHVILPLFRNSNCRSRRQIKESDTHNSLWHKKTQSQIRWWVRARARTTNVCKCNTHNFCKSCRVPSSWSDYIISYERTIAQNICFFLSFHCHWISQFWRLPSCRRANYARTRSLTHSTQRTITWQQCWWRQCCVLGCLPVRACTHFKKKDLEFSQTLKYAAFINSDWLIFHIHL